jgi:hypothetical protein
MNPLNCHSCTDEDCPKRGTDNASCEDWTNEPSASEDTGPNPLAALEARVSSLDSGLRDLQAEVERLSGEWHRVIASIVAVTGGDA